MIQSILGWLSIEMVAAVFGVACAIIAFYASSNGGDVTAVAVGFASGSSAFLLGVIAVSAFVPDHKLFEALINSNRVLLFGALGYAAFINLRTVPGVLNFFSKKPVQPE